MNRVDWQSGESVLLLNDRVPAEERERFRRFSVKDLAGHVFIATSGSTSLKLVALSKSAILHSARVVNEWVGANAEDIWLNSLPEFHIGGLSIYARAFLSESQVVDYREKWSAAGFAEALREGRTTLTSLVPTQIFDLVELNLKAPAQLRAVFVGGASLSEELYRRARELGWPVLPTFGCSEAASQVATAGLESLQHNDFPPVKILPHIQFSLQHDLRLCLKGASLFSGYFLFQNDEWSFLDPKNDGWFLTEDRVEITGGRLKFLGRVSEFVKINGEGVELHRLQKLLQYPGAEILAVADPRAGAKLILVGEDGPGVLQDLAESFNAKVFPFERIQAVYSVDEIPRGPLGKVLRQELLGKLDQKN